jgi:hypothetical protein
MNVEALTCSAACAEQFAALCEEGAKRMKVIYLVDGREMTREEWENLTK